MSVPRVINDGNWDTLTPYSGPDYEFPFSDRGDATAFVARLKYKQDKDAYRPRAMMSVANFDLGRAYLTKLGSPRDIDLNLYEWEDEFRNMPAARREPTSYAFSLQWWRASTGDNVDPSKYFYDVNFDIEEQSFSVAAYNYFEYSLNNPMPVLIKQRVYLRFGVLQTVAGNTAPLAGTILGEDSVNSIYAARIYERRSVCIPTYAPFLSTGGAL